MGTWYAVDLGSFSLWYGTADTADGSIAFAGYATENTIAGRSSSGMGGFLEAVFSGSFFLGQAADSVPSADPADSTAE
ncbi:hypothetical protein ETAA8_36600 [Anatilimnocola aggregata]|uniref:Uncharacterized protein n=1 Tax=Anatilimnocola aggregata TaxID=2528021 RepID=A0A517YEB5_9BACT|nr:hypothetical protein [Anatilimnocola aggregata]QDU28557.1 hypothetical protein ETAA8_36600 [Anatilimnocola aggregata]